MEKKTIRTGAPFVIAGLAVLASSLVFGLGGLLTYSIAAAAGAAGYVFGKKVFPDRVIYVERGPHSGSAEVDALITEARAQLEAIRSANDAIAEEALSAQIDDIEATCRQILLRLEEQPGMASTLRTFLRYYLPATLKLLDERAKIEAEVRAGGALQIAARIREAMSAVQTAFHKQLDALNGYRFINLESEMDVLADMLRSDGLSDEADAEAAQLSQEESDPFAGLFTKGGQ